MKQTYKVAEKFYLEEVLSEEVKKVTKSLNKKKFSYQFLYHSESSN